MPITEIIKTMPLGKPIEKVLAAKEGEVGHLLELTTALISDKNENTHQLMNTDAISKEILQQAFLDACKWCHTLELDS